MDSLGQVANVPGVDDDTSVQALGSAGKLRQDHGTVALLLAGNVLVRNEVHAITGGGNETSVGNGVEGDELLEGDALVHKVDGDKLDSA